MIEIQKNKCWFRTFSGKLIDPENLTTDNINSIDIARSLSLQCRYAGQICRFYCVTPDTKILTKDLNWVLAGNLNLGDDIYSIEEKANLNKRSRRNRKKLLPAKITHTGLIQRDCYEIHLENGDILRSSEEHPWLISTKASGNQKWVPTKELYAQVEIKKVTRYMPKFFDVWDPYKCNNSGWLAGILDGEGTIGESGKQISLAQNEGIILSKIYKTLDYFNISYHSFKNKYSNCYNVSLHGEWAKKFKILGQIQPVRIIQNLWNQNCNRNITAEAKELVKILKIVPIGMATVVALSTSTGTYFANGYAAHNSVAEHSLLVRDTVISNSMRLESVNDIHICEDVLLRALLHDASEAYMSDIPTPFKRLLPGYYDLEAKVMEVIHKRYGLKPDPLYDIMVKDADKKVLDYEMPYLFNQVNTSEFIKCHDSNTAFSLFLNALLQYE